MMTRNPRDKGPSTKQEPGVALDQDDGKAAAAAARARAAATSRSTWPGLKDPRIVRVSRAFGGKDRHSKVSTVRGLRDRRVRLSVQTAIQLYDLQDRLGLNQPSKVVDWLLDAAQHEIDKLPPLQIPPGSCFLHQLTPAIAAAAAAAAAASASHVGALAAGPPAPALAVASEMDHMDDDGASGSLALLPGRESRDHVEHHAPFPRDQHHGVGVIPVHGNLHRLGFLSMPSSSNNNNNMINNSNSPYASSYCLMETSNVCAPTHLGGYSIAQAEEPHGYRSATPPSLSLSHPSQLLLCPSGAAVPQMFSPYAAAASADYDPKHANSASTTVFQLMGSSASSQSNPKHHHFWSNQESG